MTWNPRFVWYAQSQGRSPEEQLEHDAARYPGGKMAGFILWISEMKGLFRKASPESFTPGYAISDHEAWDEFLQSHFQRKEPDAQANP